MSAADPAANRLESHALTLVFALVSTGLLLVLPLATRSGPASAGWWTAPALMPGLALALLAGANLVSLARAAIDLRRSPPQPGEARDAFRAMLGWLRPVEFFLWFLGYIWLLGQIGYLLSTAVFLLFLLLRAGLRSPRWMLAGLGAAVAMTAVFRWGLGVWMPTPTAFEQFPDAVRKFLTAWF